MSKTLDISSTEVYHENSHTKNNLKNKITKYLIK